MNQDEIIQELIGMQKDMVASSPEDALIKRATEQDWSVEILGKAAQVFNSARTMDHFTKSASRAASFPLIDTEDLKRRFLTFNAPEPEHVVKSASPTHSAGVDLTREMGKSAGFQIIPDIPEEYRADESILDKSASVSTEDLPYGGIGRPEYIQQIHNEAEIAVGRYNAAAVDYLEGVDKRANRMSSVLDITEDDMIARHHRKEAAVDALVVSLREHAGLMHKDLGSYQGVIRKSAAAGKLDSPMVGLTDLHAEALTLLKFAKYIASGMDEQEALQKAAAFDGHTSGGEEQTEGGVAVEDEPKEKPKADDKGLSDAFNQHEAGKGKITSEGTTSEESTDTDAKTEGKDNTDSDSKKKKKEPALEPHVHPDLEGANARSKKQIKETYDTVKNVGTDASALLKGMYGLGGSGGARKLDGVTELLTGIQQNGNAEHPDQASVDRNVSDATRAVGLQRMINTDPILSEADPHKVTAMYNMLARRNPGLADDPDAIKMALREAVSYGGTPVEGLKTISQIS